MLGCPTCRGEYPIQHGIAWFGTPVSLELRQAELQADPDQAMRAAAFLNVTEGSTIALVGDWARCSTDVAGLVALRVFAINPVFGITESDRVAAIYSDNAVPLREGSLRGIAIDESGWSEVQIDAATRALAPGGRILAPVASRVPDEIEEIARDDSWWIGEKRGALVTLHRR